MIFDHIGINVGDYEKSKAFYAKALAPLGIEVVMEFEGAAGLGRKGKPEFWFIAREPRQEKIHIAFAAENREQVRKFHEAALKAGGKDNGAPGVREQYHKDYYGAFVLDPDGNNVEAVCHSPG